MQISLGTEESLRRIFGAVLVGALKKSTPNRDLILAVARDARTRFTSFFPSNIFENEYAIFYSLLFTNRLHVFSLAQLEEVVNNNRDMILNSDKVELRYDTVANSDSPTTDDEKIEAFTLDLKEKLIELSNIYVTIEEFESASRVYIDTFKNQYMLETSQNMTRIMSSLGYETKIRGRNRKLQGQRDCEEYWNLRMATIRELNEDKRTSALVIDENWLQAEQAKENTNSDDENALLPTGLVEIDEKVGTLRRGWMVGILGPPKGGKTRFTNDLVGAALKAGLNVCVWPLEGSKEEWLSMQIAYRAMVESGYSISSTDILEKAYLKPNYEDGAKVAKLVNSTRASLASPKYGRLSFITGVAYVEDFLDVIQNHYDTQNKFDIIVIDQLINIASKNTNYGKVQRISDAYMKLKNHIENVMKPKALAIIPAQLKQEVVDFIRRNPNETIDVTAGAESAETIRTPDLSIGLFSSKEERSTHRSKMYCVASRHSDAFDDFYARVDFRCCYFTSDPTLNG